MDTILIIMAGIIVNPIVEWLKHFSMGLYIRPCSDAVFNYRETELEELQAQAMRTYNGMMMYKLIRYIPFSSMLDWGITMVRMHKFMKNNPGADSLDYIKAVSIAQLSNKNLLYI